MARNRRTPTGAIRVGPLMFAVSLAVFFCTAGVGYVWHRNRNAQLSRQLRERAGKLEELRSQNQYMDRQLEDLKSHRNLEARVRELNLGLVMPKPEQILRLTEPNRSFAPEAVASARVSGSTAGSH